MTVGDPFDLSTEPEMGTPWWVSARDHGRGIYLTPLGGDRFARLEDAQAGALGYVRPGCTVWILNGDTGQLFMREGDGWVEKRAANTRQWWRGRGYRKRAGLGSVQAGRAR